MKEFDDLYSTIKRLRTDCPWDKKQTHSSLREYVLEEVYELIEAIEKKEPKAIKEELADLLIQVLLHTTIAEDNNEFTINELLEDLNNKLIRRHPHVFSNTKIENENDIKKNWDSIKKSEQNADSVMHNLPHLPALLLASKIQKKASALGFDWPSIDGVYEKIQEEIQELQTAKDIINMEEELGDILFAVCHLGNFLNINPEIALNKTIKKFIKRFENIEKELQNKNLSLEEMEKIWQDSKAEEN